MCGRFAQVIKHDQLVKLQRELRLRETDEQIVFNFNVAPTHTVAAIVSQDTGAYIGHFRWGLIPSWSRELPKYALINARNDSLDNKPSFRGALQRRRCLVPATGFYEWRQSDKQPFFIHATDNHPILMAAIYDAWYGADGSYIPSLALITLDADSFMQPIHHRMPAILNHEQALEWITHSNQDQIQMQEMLIGTGKVPLDMYPVSKRVNSVRNNDEECLLPDS
ncbi:MAG: SOS response-associated peptidase [Candidatus Cloacimonetes bacterium]|nr:SOS response-associated peptidase [Candidatus Cloacimonadota bacterium]